MLAAPVLCRARAALLNRSERPAQTTCGAHRRESIQSRRQVMQDAIMLSFTAAFFIVAFLYVRACQKLR